MVPWSFRTHLFGLDQIKESFLLPLVRVIGIGLIVWPVSVSLAAATIYHVTEKIALLSKQADMSIHFLPPSSAPNRGGRSSLVPRSMVPRDDDRFVFRVFFLQCQCTFVTAKFTWRGVARKKLMVRNIGAAIQNSIHLCTKKENNLTMHAYEYPPASPHKSTRF